jgi:cyclic pyranopterin monophosphate synthase
MLYPLSYEGGQIRVSAGGIRADPGNLRHSACIRLPRLRSQYAGPVSLSHVDDTGAARMVDVTAKDVTTREATATGRFVTTPEVIELLRGDGLPKGDALAVARIAGIAGAKRTADLVPLCHPIALHGVTVDLELATDSVLITATTRTADRTGVEMEALTAVTVAGLTLYDMVKAVDRSAVLTSVQLVHKLGGRTGEWQR